MIQYVNLIEYQKITSLPINEMENENTYNNFSSYNYKLMGIMQWSNNIVFSLLFQSQNEYYVRKLYIG